MPPYNYPAKSLEIQTQLMGLGLMPTHLMLIGSFIVAYGMFETTLERALWTLSETSVEGTRPFTEKMNTEAQFKMLGEGNHTLSNKCNAVLKVAAQAAEDLSEYRNILVHGYILSFGPEHVPSFMKNPHWYGASGGRRPSVTHTSTSRFKTWCSLPRGRFGAWCIDSKRSSRTQRHSSTSRR